MTRIAAIKTPHTSKNTPNGTQYANQHIAIMKIEKMCLLGNDLPFVLLCMKTTKGTEAHEKHGGR